MVFNEFSVENLQKYKDNVLIYWPTGGGSETIYTYGKILEECTNILRILTKFNVPKNQRFVVNFDHSPALIVIILSILNYPGVICPISTLIPNEELQYEIDVYEPDYYLTTVPVLYIPSLILKRRVLISDEYIYFYCYDSKSKLSLRTPICYTIKTSGSTGAPKIVQVPHECILPNVTALSKTYNITEKDVIFVISPPTFDPFFVDILLALKNGCSLLLINKINRFNSEILTTKFKADCSGGVTILQLTPSVFQSFTTAFVEQVMFNEDSSLRVLTLGGEPFPMLDGIKKLLSLSSSAKIPKRIFNIYGITEVSCWSTIFEIEASTTEVALGTALDAETLLEVRDVSNGEALLNGIGELFIGSRTRKCLIDTENSNNLTSNEILYRSTGDVVIICDSDKIIYKGRTKNIVKRFGHPVNLTKIENEFKNFNSNIINACCTYQVYADKTLLIIFYVGDMTENDMKMFIKLKLEKHEYPDEIIKLDKFPLSCHGKISKDKLQLLHEKTCINKKYFGNVAIFFEFVINELFGSKDDASKASEEENEAKRAKTYWDSSFILAGGTSIQALQISMKIDNFTNQSNPKVLQMLLNDECILKDILNLLQTIPLALDRISSPIMASNSLMKIYWAFNFHKCVDASPTITEINSKTFVIVGSHSYLLITLDAISGKLISKVELPDRIESQVTIFKENYAFVGCYNGFLYKFEIESGAIVWSFDSNGMIKCKPLLAGDSVIFGNYSATHNFFALNTEDGAVLWSLKLGTKAIYSSPILLEDKYCLACTLDGTYAKVNIETGDIAWTQKLSTPIFSTPKLITEKNVIIIAEVGEQVHAINNLNGQRICTFQTGGTIFSSIEIYSKNQQHYIIFGCHNCCLYNIKLCVSTFHLVWQVKQQSEIFAAPRIFDFHAKQFVVSCATKGYVNICELSTGKLKSSLQMSGEIFSSASIYFNKIFVGCRDNHLYCINVLNDIV